MVDTRSKIQLADLNSKPNYGKILRNLFDRATSVLFYPPPGSLHYQQLCLGHFHEKNHINFEQKKKSEIKKTKNLVHTIVLQKTAQIISKKLRNYIIFIFTDANTQMIKNHPRIYVLI